MSALDALDVAIAKAATAANNAAARLNDLGTNSVPAADVQSRADQLSSVADALQTAVDNNTPKP